MGTRASARGEEREGYLIAGVLHFLTVPAQSAITILFLSDKRNQFPFSPSRRERKFSAASSLYIFAIW